MTEHMLVILGLAVGTFAIRFSGYLLGGSIPVTGPWGRALRALPGCLIAALLAMILVQAGPAEWAAAAVSMVAALVSRNLPLTMVAGVGAVGVLRSLV